MADQSPHRNLGRAAVSLALNLGWTIAVLASATALGRYGEILAQAPGLASILLFQLLSIALGVRALADVSVGVLRLICAAILRILDREPATP